MKELILYQMIVTSALIFAHFSVAAISFNKDSAFLHYSSALVASGYVGYLLLLTVRMIIKVV